MERENLWETLHQRVACDLGVKRSRLPKWTAKPQRRHAAANTSAANPTSKATACRAPAAPQVHPQRSAPQPRHRVDLIGLWALSNNSAIERRCASLPGRRSVKKDYQAAWLLKAISLIDLTTLSGDDTEARVRRLCAKARQPVRADILSALGMDSLTTGAVCVYHDMIPAAVRALHGTQIPVAAVSTGFPAGLSPFHLRVEEIRDVQAGAKEIDIDFAPPVLSGNWCAL